MKKIIFILTLLFTLTLSACDSTEVDDGLFEYSDLGDKELFTHADAEDMSNDKYIVYYYHEACSHCQNIKQEILSIAYDFEYFDFYIFDISNAPDVSSYEEFVGTPTVFVLAGGEIIESYIGGDKVLEFIDIYTDIQFDYELFTNQQLTTYSEILDIEVERYLVYYYLETCPNCIEIKDTVLSWAFTKNVNDLYFMNGDKVIDPDNILTEHQIIALGTPVLIVMNNGVFTDEYYLGKDAILDYIELDTE
jgi:glutaredoxin-related protein